jgi:hypothetical protein
VAEYSGDNFNKSAYEHFIIAVSGIINMLQNSLVVNPFKLSLPYFFTTKYSALMLTPSVGIGLSEAQTGVLTMGFFSVINNLLSIIQERERKKSIQENDSSIYYFGIGCICDCCARVGVEKDDAGRIDD